MYRINPDIDIIADIIEAVLFARPSDTFCKSIAHQYMERGGLSKKQLEGLQGKAARIPGIPQGKLATLEAIIKTKHVTHRSEVTVVHQEQKMDAEAGNMIEEILSKYPQHKRVVLFKTLFDKDKILGTAEKEELIKFYKILINDKK
ncbi:MAG: hypothetical protein ACKVOM_04320 [Ferruginibacter sp.]